MTKTNREIGCLKTLVDTTLTEASEVNYFSIKEIEALTGVKAHTIRIWEQRYNMVEPKRTETNIRFYDEADLRKLLNISALNRNGLKISEIAALSEEELKQKVLQISTERNDYDSQIQALTVSMLELDELAFEKLLSTSFLQMGIERSMIHVIFPFFRSIGVMWQTGSINPAHEHFITNIIRQKLIVAIDGQNIRMDGWGKKYMLFLPEGEFHEIGLLFANYVIRARGHQVVYIGANVPYRDLKGVFNVYKPDCMLTILTSPLINVSGQQFINDLSEEFPNTTIYTSGMLLLSDPDLKIPSNVRLMRDFKEMQSLVSELS